MTRILDPKEIDRLLFENAYRLKAPGWFFAVDTNIDPKEQWEKATLRVLIQFMGTGETRSVSSTDVVLLSLIKESLGDQVFVDSCFLPDQDNAAVLDELRLPWSFGNSSHHSIHDYDIVLLSNSIVEEKYDVFPIFDCSDFPLWTTQRRSDSKLPLVLYGGAASPVAEPLYGKSMDGVNRCLVDVSYIGHAEPYFFDIFRLFLMRKVEGTLLSDKVGTIEALYQFPAIYNPLAYEHVLAEDNWTIKEIKKVDPKAPDKVKHAKVSLEHVNDRAGFEIKTLFNDGNYDSNDIQISYGCSGGRECSFCHEGHAHAWREKSLEKIMDECKKARSHSLAYSYSGYSFNTNFHSRYIDIMWSAAKIYPSMSAIGMRADEIAARPDYFLMNKAFGMQQITMGVEGISDRIRNGYLNKSLSKQSLLDAAKPCFQNKFRKLKLYFILTGREEMSDWEEGVELLQDLLKLRDSYGANTHIKVTFSILCYYPETPIAWDARLAVLHTMQGGRIPYFIEKCSELGVGVKFTSRGCSVAYQQLLLDIGRPMTALLERMWKEKKWVYYRNVNDEVFGNLLGFMKDANLPTAEKMMEARPYDFIFPNAVIHVKSEKWLIEASKLVNQYKAKAYCMVTQAKPDHRGCEACGLCKDKKEIDSVVCRVPDASVHSVGDVQIQISLNKPRYRYRFAFQSPKQYDFLRKKSLGVFFLTQFLTEEEKEHVYDIDNQADPTRWNANNFLTYPFHGQWIIDLKTREELPSITVDKRPVNALLKNTTVTQVPLDFKVRPDDMVLAVIEIKNDPRIVDGMREWDFSKIPYIEDDRPFKWGYLDSKVAAPMIKKGETFKIVLAVPVRAHLIRLLVELTGKTYYRVLSELFIGMQHVMYMRPIQGMVCKVCGAEAVMDLSTLKTVDLCPSCLQKVVFKKI